MKLFYHPPVTIYEILLSKGVNPEAIKRSVKTTSRAEAAKRAAKWGHVGNGAQRSNSRVRTT